MVFQKHPIYWFEDKDADLFLYFEELPSSNYSESESERIKVQLQSVGHGIPDQLNGTKSDGLLYRVHSTIFSESGLFKTALQDAAERNVTVIALDRKCVANRADLDALLTVSYESKSASTSVLSLPKIIRILRITAPSALDIPALHSEARKTLVRLIPGDVKASLSCDWQALLNGDAGEGRTEVAMAMEAMMLSLEFGIRETQKALMYYLATRADLDAHSLADPTTARISATSSSALASTSFDASPSSRIKVSSPYSFLPHLISLQSNLIDAFTPLLFTPPPASHMHCTDAIAEQWMNVVCGPAIAGESEFEGHREEPQPNGARDRASPMSISMSLSAPLESLEHMRSLPWASYGVCEACVQDKCGEEGEWSAEQRVIWDGIQLHGEEMQ